jgi:tRNA nucleotidyltransferase (CCA-adding enzyme)
MVQKRNRKRIKLSPNKIAVSHHYADFDALASIVAISKLFPGTIPVLSISSEVEVQRFISIYKDYLNLYPIDEISFDDVKEVYLVDTQDISRIKPLYEETLKRDLYISVFDHHPIEEELKFNEVTTKTYGSTMTILYELIKKKNINFNQVEATLFLLGIYEDTGSLTFSSTTERDLEACGYFLKKGGKLTIVSEFVYPALNKSQKELFSKFLDAIETVEIKGVNIAVCPVSVETYVEGVSFLTHKLMETTDVDALFTITKFKDSVLIVGRSKDANIVNVGKAIENLGGGGHPQAASAFLQKNNKDLNSLVLTVLRAVKENTKSTRRVEDFMSSPVKVITPDTSAEEALKLMLRYGYSGLPVVVDEKLVGIISRRDIGRISEEKLKKMPVSYYMSKNPKTIPSEISIKEAEKIMIEKDYGRLPVVKSKKIVGILTRSDLLRALYGIEKESNSSNKNKTSKKKSIKDLLKNKLSDELLEYLKYLGKIGDELKINAYLVGGSIRNLILGYDCKDFDILIDKDFYKFIENVRKDEKFKDKKIMINKIFNTAKIQIDENLIFDIALARKEYYEYPAALPTVSIGSLREDLYRRDFTINALAASLNSKTFGEIIDYFNCYEDIISKKIKILHKLSFIEDPSRIIRAVEYEFKYGFKMDKETEEAAINAMNIGIFERISKFRILSEFMNLIEDVNYNPSVIKRLSELNALRILSGNIKINKNLIKKLESASRLIKLINPRKKWFSYIIILTLNLTDDETCDILERLKAGKKEIKVALNFRKNYKILTKKLSKATKNSEIAEVLNTLSDEELVMLGSLLKNEDVDKILKYENEIKPIKLELSGDEIEKITNAKREKLGEIIKKLLFMKYDGIIKDKDDEVNISLSMAGKDLNNVKS